MAEQAKALQAVYRAIERVNRQRSSDRQLARDPSTRLTGPGGQLDSLGLVTFVVALEQEVEEAFGESITLTDDRLLSDDDGVFATVASLAAYIERASGRSDGG